jgi:hypothetical protein
MKTLRNIVTAVWVVMFIASCEDNEVMPAYTKQGTATATVASITPSKTKPATNETIVLTLKYINTSDDPVKQIELKVKVGLADYVTVQTFDEQSAEKNKEIVREVNYQAPATTGTVIVDMVITSQKEYPQIKRTTLTVQ